MKPTSLPSRQMLEDVPRVGFYPDVKDHGGKPWPEDIIFPSCMRAVMEYLGHDEYDYIHFVGVTGAGFFLNWKEGWHDDNGAISYMAPFAEHTKLFEYAFESTGYRLELLPLKGEHAIDPTQAREQIMTAIQARRPVVSHGVVGPPEASLICGYDDDAQTLIGWSFFQTHHDEIQGVTFEPNGMFRKPNGLAQAWDLMRLGERGEPMDPQRVRRRSLQWAVRVARTAETWGGRHNGLAAYDAWADHLLRDGDITADGTVPPGATARPFDAHDDAVGCVAEARHYASKYLVRVADQEQPMRADLLKAAGCYAREHDLMWQAWACVGGNGRSPRQVRRFADPGVRRSIIDLIHQAKREEEQAVAHLERALTC